MRKARRENGLRREYDLSKLKGGVRGKYYRQYSEGTNLVLLDPDIADAFPNARAVNEALRVLVDLASRRARPTRRKKRA